MQVYQLICWSLDEDAQWLFYGKPSEAQINRCLAEFGIIEGPIKEGFNTTENPDIYVILKTMFVQDGEHDLTGPMPVL
jgi:hypothetical protein